MVDVTDSNLDPTFQGVTPEQARRMTSKGGSFKNALKGTQMGFNMI
jgi:hypothetical protein